MGRNEIENEILVMQSISIFYFPEGAYPASGRTISQKLCSKSTSHVGFTTTAS